MDNTTAKVSCFARAYHFENNKTHIFADSMAKTILGDDFDQIAESMMKGISFFLPGFEGTKEEGLRLIVDKQLSSSVLGRSAYCERKLLDEITTGCGQYIIFASGYDTFSLRNENAAVQVYELDLPDMLDDKKKRLDNAGLKTAAKYVPCDLADKNWVEKLLEKGFNTSEQSYGSLLGISYYLEKDEWKKLIRLVSGIMPADSAICFDFPSTDESKETKVNKTLASGAGEQMKAQYSFAEMEALLSECGFKVAEHLGSEDMTERYFADYNRNSSEHPMAAPVGVEYVFAVKGENIRWRN
ncbi:MAG: class I SAM-dependent methyltransferase [Lachnospiraceae bacterium]|nr:class I SAM-dependent methyltransferase [Lachnospiraceae bacterium]